MDDVTALHAALRLARTAPPEAAQTALVDLLELLAFASEGGGGTVSLGELLALTLLKEADDDR